MSVTADASSAISDGRSRAQQARRALQNADALKRLIDSHSELSRCKEFEARVDCFRLCPDVDDDGRMQNASPSWREGC